METEVDVRSSELGFLDPMEPRQASGHCRRPE